MSSELLSQEYRHAIPNTARKFLDRLPILQLRHLTNGIVVKSVAIYDTDATQSCQRRSKAFSLEVAEIAPNVISRF